MFSRNRALSPRVIIKQLPRTPVTIPIGIVVVMIGP